MRRWVQDTRGMTLVELMVALLVSSMIMGAVASLLVTSLKVYAKGDVSAQAQAGGRIALDRLTRELRQARRLINGVSETVAAGTFTFDTVCAAGSAPQISFALPHTAVLTLSDGTTAYTADPSPATGAIPYDGRYVSYYLSSAQTAPTGAAAPAVNSTGPYLIRTQYDLTAASLSWTTVTSDITSLGFGSSCGTGVRDLPVTVTASLSEPSENVGTTDVVTSDVTLRNQ